MSSRQLWIGVLALTVSGTAAEAARGKGTARRQVSPSRVARPATGVRRARPIVVSKRAGASITRMAKTVTPARAAKKAAPSRAVRYAQATQTPPPALPPAQSVPPPENRALPTGPVTISQEAEPLMTRALAAYYVMGDESVRDLRARGWEYGDIAAAGNLAARSRRSFAQVARAYEERRDWSVVAQEMNVAPEQVYIAANTPRYVMIRPTPQEMERMQIARLDEAYQRTLEQYRQALAQAQPPMPDRRIAEAAPETAQAPAPTPEATAPAAPATPDAVQPNAVPADPNAAPVTTLDPTRISTNYQSAIITPVERVASARLELAPTNSSALLRRAVAHYYALHPASIRDLEAQGWSLNDVLVAGNLAHRSEATFEEVVALRQGGEEWRGIAERIGVPSEEVYAPTMARRVDSGDWMLLRETRENGERRIDRQNGERRIDRDNGERRAE